MNIIDSLKWRYATKKFDTKKHVSDDKLAILKEAFTLTATSYGLQPVKLVVVSNKELQKELVPYSFNQEQVAQASHVLIICIENTVDEAYIRTHFENEKSIRGVSDKIIDSFRSFLIADFSSKKDTEIKEWATKQAYITLGNLLTVCALEKIDSCPMEGFVPVKYDELLNLKNMGLSSVLVLPIGYRADKDMFSKFKKVRKSIETNVITI
ncbi:MAG: NAD(P)H-dependent oxidoreductase [Kordia sp.]|nr:MAG: NAD(P)H-dependent oxidoreductase [Kordia sp.]